MEQHSGLMERANGLARAPMPGRTTFSQLEWVVIDFSRKDSLSSLTRPGPTRRFLMHMIGMRASAPLAAPRLEALRRMAVALRAEQEEYVVLEEAAFYEAGYRTADLVQLASIIDADRDPTHRRRH